MTFPDVEPFVHRARVSLSLLSERRTPRHEPASSCGRGWGSRPRHRNQASWLTEGWGGEGIAEVTECVWGCPGGAGGLLWPPSFPVQPTTRGTQVNHLSSGERCVRGAQHRPQVLRRPGQLLQLVPICLLTTLGFSLRAPFRELGCSREMSRHWI